MRGSTPSCRLQSPPTFSPVPTPLSPRLTLHGPSHTTFLNYLHLLSPQLPFSDDPRLGPSPATFPHSLPGQDSDPLPKNNGLDTIVYAKSLWHNNFKDRSTSLYALEVMIMFYYDVMKYLSGTKGLFFEDKIESVQAISEKNNYISIAKKIEYIDEAKNNIKRNLNVNLLIDKLIIEMCGD